MTSLSVSSRFYPASRNDFNDRASSLARLISAQLSGTRDLLASVYGFGSVHELERALDGPSRFAGPYDSEHDPFAALAKQRQSTLDSALTAWGYSPDGPARYAEQLGLFHAPVAHRRMVRALRDHFAKRAGAPSVFPASIDDAIEVRDGRLELTFPGQALLVHLDGSRGDPGHLDAMKLAQEPWSVSAYVAHTAMRIGLGPWINPVENRGSYVEPDGKGLNKFLPNLPDLLSLITHAERGYAEVLERAAAIGDDLLAQPNQSVMDGVLRFYPELLYWGGLTRLAAHQYEGAIDFFKRAEALGLEEASGVRLYRHIAELNSGPEPGRRLSSLPSTSVRTREPVTAGLLRAFHAYATAPMPFTFPNSSGDDHIERALIVCPHLIRAIDASFHDNDDCVPHVPEQSLAHAQEFLHRTWWYQQRYGWVMERLRKLTGSQALREAYVRYHHGDAVISELREAFIHACGGHA